ncbi:MAG: hypothetical protein KJ613_01635 [Nanoarchaeota archaeon]|nr:hypothetical protein [Nanoarchaeota archaeon]
MKTKIFVVLNKNKEVVNEVRNKTLKYFDKGYVEPHKSEINNRVFHTMFDVDAFLVTTAKELLSKHGGKEKPAIYVYWTHLWVPLFLDKKVYKNIKEFSKITNSYVVSKNNTIIDKWCYHFWKKPKMNVDIGVDFNARDFVVFNDVVIQIFYPDELLKEMKRIYSAAKSVHDLDADALFKTLFERKTIIPVTVDKNPILAKQLSDKFKKHFKKR